MSGFAGKRPYPGEWGGPPPRPSKDPYVPPPPSQWGPGYQAVYPPPPPSFRPPYEGHFEGPGGYSDDSYKNYFTNWPEHKKPDATTGAAANRPSDTEANVDFTDDYAVFYGKSKSSVFTSFIKKLVDELWIMALLHKF